MVSRVIPVDPFDLVIFGGTGDLARRKILPGLYRRYCAGQMPEEARIIGAARTEMDAAGYREMVAEAIEEFGGKDACDNLDAFLAKLDYVAIDARGETGWAELQGLSPLGKDTCDSSSSATPGFLKSMASSVRSIL